MRTNRNDAPTHDQYLQSLRQDICKLMAEGSSPEKQKHWTKEDVEHKLKEIQPVLKSTTNIMNQLNHCHAPKHITCEMFRKMMSIFNQKNQYKDYLRRNHIQEESLKTNLNVRDTKQAFSTPFKLIRLRLEKQVFASKQFEHIACTKQKKKEYHGAVSQWSRIICTSFQKVKKLSKTVSTAPQPNKDLIIMAMYKKLAYLLINRARCLFALEKYEQCLIDLNAILRLALVGRDPIEDRIEKRYYELIEDTKYALWERAHLWIQIGNTANATNDLISLNGMEAPTHERKLEAAALSKVVEMGRSGYHSHPSPEMMKNCESFSLKLNNISKHGWIKLQTNHQKSLPKRQGHIMIAHHSYLYIFGGSSIVFGCEAISSTLQRKKSDRLCFMRINTSKFNMKTYEFERLSFPSKMKCYLMGSDYDAAIKYQTWSRMVTGNKWRNNLVVFGGYNRPFRNVLLYNLDTAVWELLHVRNMPNCLKRCRSFTHHTSVILNDVMYVFGGQMNNDETNLFCSLDLVKKQWRIITAHNTLNVESIDNIDYNIPGSRYDHLMWADPCIASGSIYIAYGHHHRTQVERDAHETFQRADVWRFDVSEQRWYDEKRHGNYPVCRAECAFTRSDDNGVFLFGGYNTNTWQMLVDEGKWETFSFFGDCYEYQSKYQKWIMIQSKIFPCYRAYSAMCLIPDTNVLCLYGGYRGGQEDNMDVYDDLWILDLNALKRGRYRNTSFKTCEYKECDQTQNDTKLFKCMGISHQTDNTCRTFYCSKYCQKRDWCDGHREICERRLD